MINFSKKHQEFSWTWFVRFVFTICFILPTLLIQGQDDLGLDTLEQLVLNNLWDDPKLAQRYAIEYNEQALSQSDISLQAKGQNFNGLTHYVQGDYLKAVEYYLNAYELIKQTDDKRYTGILLNNIGAAYRVRDKPDETEQYYKKALEIFNEINDTLWIANVTNNLAIILNSKGEFVEAENFFLQAQNRYVQLQDSASLRILAINLAAVYNDMDQWEKAQPHIDYFFDSDPPIDDLYVYGRHLVARKAMQDREFKKAESILLETLKITVDKGFSNAGLNAKKHYYNLLKLQGKYKSSLTAYEDFVAEKDSIFSNEKDQQLTEMLEKYESREKETEIERLALADELNQLRIGRQRLGLLGAIGGFGLLSFFFIRLRQKNRRIEKQDQEKEILLKEIHHRVKNNLQVISSLLSIQGRSIKDETARAAIQEGRSRVQSMSLIHQNLYTKDNLSGISMPGYVDHLSKSLIKTYSISSDTITLETDIDDIILDVETVVPIGLIINELITNAIKYAFPEYRIGTINIILKKKADYLHLAVKDNGIGINTNRIDSKDGSFGLSLINAFKSKLDANLEIDGTDGTAVSLQIRNYKQMAS